MALELLHLLPEASSNQVQSFRVSSGHMGDHPPIYYCLKNSNIKLLLVKLPRSTEYSPFHQAEIDSLEVD